jgi:hypothetical protein
LAAACARFAGVGSFISRATSAWESLEVIASFGKK